MRTLIQKLVVRKQIQRLTILLLSTYLSIMPALAWEEADKSAFLEKISIMKALITSPELEVKGKMSRQEKYNTVRQRCLLSSIGIDVIHHYLEMNPSDQEWQRLYKIIRDELSTCLYVMYHI